MEDQHETPRRGDDNEIGFRNVDEDAEHDEAGSQGDGPGDAPTDEPGAGDDD
jgi:hypothetical protein